MKKILIMMLVAVFALSTCMLAACDFGFGGNSSDKEGDGTQMVGPDHSTTGSADMTSVNAASANAGQSATDSKGMLMINASKVFTEDDFITLSEDAAKAPRRLDGSLPDNGFAKLKTTSKYYGTGMGLLY